MSTLEECIQTAGSRIAATIYSLCLFAGAIEEGAESFIPDEDLVAWMR